MKRKKGFYEVCVKRPLDFVCALGGIIVLSPVLLVTAGLVKIKLGSPVIFKQERPGKNEKIFTLYKFRTMTDARDTSGELLPDSVRLTKFGALLRKTSLDELPELFNILLGDMSIVGPRPLSIYYLPFFSSKERTRQRVRPGLTGLAQINGRNNLQWDERLKFDFQYVENVSLKNDLTTMIKTIQKVLHQSDVTVRGQGKILDFSVYSVLREEGIKMKTYEIGSYFHLTGKEKKADEINVPRWLNLGEDLTYTFSGRAAIDLAIKDILRTRTVQKVYMPSYCCISMVQPFLNNNIKVIFYNVSYKNGKINYNIDTKQECDLFFAMNYFGFQSAEINHYIAAFKNKGKIVIEDITHSLLCDEPFYDSSDYLVASLRKWVAIPTGGLLCKKRGKLEIKAKKSGDLAVQEKMEAMQKKYLFLAGKINDKTEFLVENAKFDNQLIHMDSTVGIDHMSAGILEEINIEEIKKQRRENAFLLYKELKKQPKISFLFPNINTETDTPLFVPIMMKKEERDSLRNYLIQYGIYCPIHWPEVMGTKSNIRDYELSIICDQRYSKIDMIHIIEKINEWSKTR